MSKCPECSTKLNTLLLWERTWTGYMVNYDPSKADNMSRTRYHGDKYVGYVVQEFTCPSCSAVLFSDQREAMNFLTGGEL